MAQTTSDVQTKILEIQVNYSEALEKIANYRIEIEKVKARQAELKEAYRQGTITQEEYHKGMESAKLMTKQLSDAAAVLTKQVRNQIKAQGEQEGSLVQLRAQLSNLTAEYDRLSRAEREGAAGTALRDRINEVTTAIKGAEEETQRYYRNVGNYPQAMEPLRQQLDTLVAKLTEMKQAGLDTSPAFDQMQQQAEGLRDTLASSSNVGVAGMGQLNTGIMMLVSAFAMLQGPLGSMGEEGKDFAKTLTICVTALTAAATAAKIWNAMQKDSALMTAATAAKTWLLNTALAAKITAMTAATAATGGATVATTLWNAALAANPLVWLVAIITAAVAAVYGLVKAFTYFFSNSEQRKKALAEEAEQLERLHTLHQQSLDMAAARGASEEELATRTIDNLKAESDAWEAHFEKIKKEYDEDKEEYKAALESKQKAFEEFNAALDDGLIMLTKLQTQQHEAERRSALGEYEYKRTLINEQYEQQMNLAAALLKHNRITLEEYQNLTESLTAMRERNLAEINDAEAEAAAAAEEKRRKAAEESRKKAAEEAARRQAELEKEMEKAQSALTALITDNLERQRQQEEASYQSSLKALQQKMQQYQSQSQYDVQMRQAIADQIYALEEQHQRKLTELQYAAAEERAKALQQELEARVQAAAKGSDEEMTARLTLLAAQHQQEIDAINRQLAAKQITEEEASRRLLASEEAYNKDRDKLAAEYDALDTARIAQALKNRIAELQLAAGEETNTVRDGQKMTDEEYQKWREKGLAGMSEYTRQMLLLEEQLAQAQLDAIINRGQLSTQTTEEYEAEVIAAQSNLQEKQAQINDAIVKDEETKAAAMKNVYTTLTGLIDTLGENNEAFAKLSKVIALAQIAIETGKALASGIASAAAMPFPANIAAIATTVATILANIATAISTVKSAKFAEGGKVTGPGSGTSDSIPAMLSNGEFVVTAAATRLFEPLLVAMNAIGAGTPMQATAAADGIAAAEMMTGSFTAAAVEIRPVVSAVEITKVQNRVSVIENLDTY